MIIGIDLGKRKIAAFYHAEGVGVTGIARFESPPKERYEEIQWLTDEFSDWLDMLSLSIKEEILTFCEAPIVGISKNYQTAIDIAQISGVILSCRVRTYLVPPPAWKKTVLGKGNATKEEVAAWLKEVKPEYFRLCDGDQDLIDACCIALYGEQVSQSALDIRRSSDV
jgi:Holliday junction resolvasome RuvABC endonuclease subunit